MSGSKACGKQAAQYTGKQPDEGSAVTSQDTAEAESEVHSSGHTQRKSMSLKEMSAAKQAGGKGETEKGKQPAAQKKRTRTGSKLRRRNHCCSPLTPPLLQLWKPSLLRTGAGLGRLAGRSC